MIMDDVMERHGDIDTSLMRCFCVSSGNSHIDPVFHGRRTLVTATDGRKRPRSVMATDSDWRLIRRRADKAGISTSEFLVGRGLAPAEAAAESAEDLPLAVKRRAAADLRLLVLAERLRFEAGGRGGVWRRLVEEAEALMAADEGEG